MNKYARLTYEVKFNKPQFNKTYNFIRDASESFKYGNGTSVDILKGDEYYQLVDTRYDNLVMKDFKAWCENWLKNNLNKKLDPKWELLITSKNL